MNVRLARGGAGGQGGRGAGESLEISLCVSLCPSVSLCDWHKDRDDCIIRSAVRRGRIVWPSAHDWKSCIPQGVAGSNPALSAKASDELRMTSDEFSERAGLVTRRL